MQLNKDNKYLVTYLVALFILTVCLWFTDLGLQNLNYIILGFCWNFTIHAPSLRERLELRKYKFSLLRLIFGIDRILSLISDRFLLSLILRSTPPIIFSALCYLVSLKGFFGTSLIGSIFFEIIFHRERILRVLKFRKADL